MATKKKPAAPAPTPDAPVTTPESPEKPSPRADEAPWDPYRA